MFAREKVPFVYDKKEDFPNKLAEWIGQIFYDILPEHGYEIREEQIFTAFQFADAFCHKRVHFAEAGLGTGKTFAYLLTAIAYARFSGKPVVIACASTALQEQLAGSKGDIQTLSRILGFEIDARMAKDPRQYVCDARVTDSTRLQDEKSDTESDEITLWLEKTKRGERSEMPLVPDHIWKQIGWDESMSCDICASRGFCKLVKARDHYRGAKDLIIADHGIFFDDLWTREVRLLEGISPILPSYAGVIFDEGHKVIVPAAMRAGQHIVKEDMDNIVFSIEQIQGARESLIDIAITLDLVCEEFFISLDQCVMADERSKRLAIRADDALYKASSVFYHALDQMLLEIQVEQELYLESLPISLLQTYEAQIEMAMMALNRFRGKRRIDYISWVDQLDGSFWVVPRNLSRMLDTHLFQKKLPVVFTSATLSNEGDFSYFARTLGLKNPSHSTVGSSFALEKQVVVYLPPLSTGYGIEQLVSLLKLNGGRALVLTNSLDEVSKIREGVKDHHFPFEILWEDQAERGYLVREFREKVSSVLIGYSFWEGIDVPGDALSLLIVWQLPFPSLDPLIEVQRKEAVEVGLDPITTVDYPEMGLKLKQGCGRLIRAKDDRGAIVIMESVLGTPWEQVVRGALPPGARVLIKE
ncbi:MAG: ATP-dependent DNA helicase [Firmicutes bacterium]|nr:ATP-dependent DNA helicase [Bacillota bacterium]